MIVSRASSVLFQISSTLKSPKISHYYPLCQLSNNLNKKKPIFITQILIRPFSVISKMEQHIGTNSSGGGGGSGVASLSAVSRGGDDRSSGLVSFQISSWSLLKIQKGDITRWSVDGSSDAIVNPANERMLGGGGADGAIHRAAGPELRDACYKVKEVRPGVRCPTGEARITRGFRLPASHVIHTVGPIYDEDRDPEASLSNAYKNSLRVAKENNIQYVAFPAISCGVYRYPFDEAASVALSAVKKYGNDLKEIHFVLFSDEIYDAWFKKAKNMFSD